MVVEFSIKLGDITKEDTEAIVNPANSYGSMGGGAAWAIKKAGGDEIEHEAIERGPTPVGAAVATTAGRLPSRLVIHAPTMESPAQQITPENAEKATYAALMCAKSLSVKSIAFPGMGTGVGGVAKKDAAAVMVKAIKRFLDREDSNLERITLVAFDDELKKAFTEAMEKC